MTNKGVFIVRAVVPEADRAAFDDWYQKEHLEEAKELFNASKAWRGWSRVEPEVHIAFYEFRDIGSAVAIQESEALKMLISKFGDKWGDRVSRTREVLEVAV